MVLLVTWLLVLIATLAPATICSATPFSVSWTAPGDDGVVGRASAYDLRYSKVFITALNFYQATLISGLPPPAAAGTSQSFVVSGLSDGVLYYLAMKSVDESGNWSPVSNVITRPAQTTGVELPTVAVALSSPWPNPARESVHWSYSLPRAAQVQVDVFDVTGRRVSTVASGERGAGMGDMSWDLRDDGGRPVDAGLYFVKARVGSMESTKRLIVLR
jgi:hypothetical protein